MEHFLSQGFFANAVDEKGWTPLHVAAVCDKTELAKLLIAHGVDISIKEEIYGATPLHIAAVCGFSKIAKMLLNNKASLANVQDRCGNTPLHVTSNREIAEALLQKDASLTIENKDKLTPFCAAVIAGHTEVVRYLLATKVSLDQVNADGNTPLHMVASYGTTNEVLEVLMKQGPKTAAVNAHGATPLQLAARKGHKEIVKVLIDRGAILEEERIKACVGQDLETYTLHERHYRLGTPLNIAAFEGHKEVV